MDFLCAAVWIGRVRPDLLTRFWIGTVLGSVILTLAWHARDLGAPTAVAMLGPRVAAAIALPTGMAVLALHWMRRSAPGVPLWRPVLAAAAAFALGTLLLIVALPVVHAWPPL